MPLADAGRCSCVAQGEAAPTVSYERRSAVATGRQHPAAVVVAAGPINQDECYFAEAAEEPAALPNGRMMTYETS